MKITVLKDVDGFVVDALLQLNGAAIDLTTATAITFTARIPGRYTSITRACTVLDAVTGSVRLTLLAADTAVVGVYIANFTITFPTGDIPVPNTSLGSYQVIDGV